MPQNGRRAARRLTLCIMEDRTVPAAVPLSVDEQLLLELINRGRADPAAEAARLGVDLNEGLAAGTISTAPKQPLAPNAALLSATRSHLQYLATINTLSHSGADGSRPWDRGVAAGYGSYRSYSENLALGYADADETAAEVDHLYRLLFVDEGIEGRGHRTNLLDVEMREVGPAVLADSATNLPGSPALFVGQDFAWREGPAFLTGVAYSDSVTADNFYTPGEGRGGLAVLATDAGGTAYSTTTGPAGGYALQLPAGTYTVTVGDETRTVSIGADNVKADFTGDVTAPTPATPPPVVSTGLVPTEPPTQTSAQPPTQAAGPVSAGTPATETQAPDPFVAVGAGDGAGSTVTLVNALFSQASGSFEAYPGRSVGARVATGDVTGDGVADVVTVPGPGSPVVLRVFDGQTFNQVLSADVFESSFTGGGFAAVGDFDGDGLADVAVTPDEGGGPRVRVFGGDGTLLADFFGIEDTEFRGGARPGVADISGDGVPDLMVAAGFGGGPRVAGFDGRSLAAGRTAKLFGDFFAFEPSLRDGVYLAGGDIDGDGSGDLVVGAGPGGGPRVLTLDGAALRSGQLVPLSDFFAGDTADRGGVRVAVKDFNGDGRADLAAGPGAGDGSRASFYTDLDGLFGTAPRPSGSLDVFGGSDGVYVG